MEWMIRKALPQRDRPTTSSAADRRRGAMNRGVTVAELPDRKHSVKLSEGDDETFTRWLGRRPPIAAFCSEGSEPPQTPRSRANRRMGKNGWSSLRVGVRMRTANQ